MLFFYTCRPIKLSEYDSYLTWMHSNSNLKFADEYIVSVHRKDQFLSYCE